ncbi:MAG: undecaprenyl-diphosphate phosphatase [Myxococcales bacterium]|nr:undecaprenyl-diphosphate phosphatase [Myxococcales bacterium]
MTDLEAAVLGAVQGLTEFLPVSSSGHLVIFQALLGVRDEGLRFEVAVHLATLASVLIFYRRRVWVLLRGLCVGEREAVVYTGKLALASLPAVVLVLAAGDALERQFEVPAVTGICLWVTGAALWSTRRSAQRAFLEAPGWGAAFWIGCAQALAILPGVSRSGTTVAAALALGVRPAAAAEFSFLMSVIVISGATLRLLPELAGMPAAALQPLWLGSAVAMLFGVAAIALFVRLLQGGSLYRFAYYTWSVGALFLAWLWLH